MSTPEHVAIIVNPSKASRDDIESALDGLEDGLRPPRVSWFETTVEDPGHGMARDAMDAGADVVVAAGGDGTVRAVAQCLADSDAAAHLGIIPLGTGNLFARNLDIAVNGLETALETIVAGEARQFDLAWAEADLGDGAERLAFTVMAGIGIDAHMIIETVEGLKDKVGWLAYVESLGRALTASEVLDLDLRIDGHEPTREQAHTLMVGNCGMLTGGVTLLPDADPADGELDMLVLSADGVAAWMETLRTMVWDNGLKRMVTGQDTAESADSVEHRRITSVTADLSKGRALELDGEDVGECERVEFSIQPAALRVRVPQE